MKCIVSSQAHLVVSHWITEYGIDPSSMKLAFIDTAAEVYNKDEQEWLINDRKALVNAGFSVEDYTLTAKTKVDLERDLSGYDVLFVSGGNAFYLLEKAQKSGFTELAHQGFFNDKWYIGSSAGAVLLSPDIDIVSSLDDPTKASLESTLALGEVNFLVLPHYDREKFRSRFEKIFATALEKSINIFPLKENQYLACEDGACRLLEVQ